MRRSLAVAAALFVLAGCGSAPEPGAPEPAGSAPAAEAAPSPTPGRCSDPELDERQVTFADSAGVYLSGYLLGTGRTALVLAPQASANACSWLSWAKQQAAAGYRVLAFDFAGEGRSRRGPGSTMPGDVTAAAAFVRSQGATAVVLIGASRGGTAVLTAAPTANPTAVVSLSAPSTYSGMDALAAVPKLTAPVLYLAATGDSGFADDAKALHAATPGDKRTLQLVPGSLHGTAFVTIAAEGAPEALAALTTFLKANAPA
ncbi:alpha/beta hydrolase [Dactylosporangium sucinum]|uniref:alpha/beta hydrolase n=1 Tax=Dactylosporangium sucinum TaxID=1424081 RepID=UPI00167CA3A1|nr:alpha/beta fold hydrolase [Dactylosporangium sucinum]